MSATTEVGVAIEPPAAVTPPVFHRPAELVDISERLYRQVFAVGLWAAAGLCAFAAASSLLQPTAGSQLRGVIVCGVYTAACALAATRPAGLYAALRSQPWLLLIAGLLLGAGAWFVGKHNFQLFVPIVAVLAVPGIATPRRVLLAAAVIAGIGLALPQLTSGHGNLGGPIAVIVPPLLFWLIVDRIAGFALRLHQRLESRGQTSPHIPATGDEPNSAASPRTTPDDTERRVLSAPHVITVDGVHLTSRQLQVILLVCEGLTHRKIGACLQIGIAQVGRHLKKSREHVGVATDAELVAWAKRCGIVPSGRHVGIGANPRSSKHPQK